MRLLLIGAPGSGKGTQATRLAEHFGLTHISSGDLLRQHVTEGTPLGKEVQQYVAHGDLVPDTLLMDVLRKPVVAASKSGGYILDGFPRTVEQAQIAYAPPVCPTTTTRTSTSTSTTTVSSTTTTAPTTTAPASTTSSVERHWTMTAGRLSIIPL